MRFPAHDLLVDFEELRRRIGALFGDGPLDRREMLDGFLFAAALDQVLEDYLHDGGLSVAKAARVIRQSGRAAAKPVASALQAVANVLSGVRGMGARGELRELSFHVKALVERCAAAVVDGAPVASAEMVRLRAAARAVASARLPVGLSRSVIKLPATFRSLDQQPEDCGKLVRLFAAARPDRERTLLVLGVRTSGSYLAPLCAAYLRALGYKRVTVATVRPRRRMLPRDMRQIRANAGSGGLCLLCDDPPKTGRALRTVADALITAGLPASSIVLLLPLFGEDAEVPAPLRQFAAVALPWRQWAIHERLDPVAVQAVLTPAFADRGEGPVRVVERVAIEMSPDPRSNSPSRRHVRALFRVSLQQQCGPDRDVMVYAKGTGLGWFGDHSVAVANALRGLVPQTYALAEGLLFREWLPESWRVDPCDVSKRDRLFESISAYVLARARSLRTVEDMSGRLVQDGPLWKLTGNWLGRAFGRLRVPAQRVTLGAARQLLLAPSPSVIDGSMAPAHWFAPPSGNVLKVDFDERAFANQDSAIDEVYCYDPVFDLAAAATDQDAADPVGDGFAARRLRRRYEEAAGMPIDAERWLLYQLTHLQNRQRFIAEVMESDAGGELSRRHHRAMFGAGKRAMARSLQGYFEETFFSGIDAGLAGPLCAIDIDGVLETNQLGFAGITPAAAVALRALGRHGFRPILASGRSLPEIRERCEHYHLAGGVAEYGAIAYSHVARERKTVLTAEARRRLRAVRKAVVAEEGVYVDPAFEFVVRAQVIDGSGARALSAGAVDRILAQADASVFAVQGQFQTDFVDGSLSKAEAIRALASMLRSGRYVSPVTPLAMAVGDTALDLPMFALARRSFAPANADATVRAACEQGIARLVGRPCQAGLRLAVVEFLGHAPESCPTCSVSRFAGNRQLLMTLLSAQDAGRAGKVARIARARWLVASAQGPQVSAAFSRRTNAYP